MDYEESISAAASHPGTENSPHREPCTLPPGWTVSTYRTGKECGTEVERGVGIRADHECGRGFVLWLNEDLNPRPLDVVLPDGEVVKITRTARLEFDEEVWLGLLWPQCMQQMRKWADQGLLR